MKIKYIQLTPGCLNNWLCLTLVKLELYGWRLHWSLFHYHNFLPKL
ncbi:unnamed protein product [marine sediment metagenome]|uniref:Uncharacterized protein n=1 Tax=marine sediment metagenome TaxID=412755 RepID=X1IQS0_9ZZZZ